MRMRKVDEELKQTSRRHAWAASVCQASLTDAVSLAAVAPESDRSVQASARDRRQERAAAGVSRPEDAARGRRAAVRRDPRRQGPRHLLLGLQQHHRHRPVRCSAPTTAAITASSASSRSRRTSTSSRRPAASAAIYHVLLGALSPLQGVGPDDLKIKGLLTRIGDGARRGGHPRHQSRPSKARPPPSTWRGCSSRSASASRASPPASRSAATSSTPTS